MVAEQIKGGLVVLADHDVGALGFIGNMGTPFTGPAPDGRAIPVPMHGGAVRTSRGFARPSEGLTTRSADRRDGVEGLLLDGPSTPEAGHRGVPVLLTPFSSRGMSRGMKGVESSPFLTFADPR